MTRLPATPHLDDTDLVRYDDEWVALSPLEARLAALLLERPGDLVSYASLEALGDDWVAKGRGARRMLLLRLRRNLARLGLVVRTERGLGYVLEVPAEGSTLAP